MDHSLGDLVCLYLSEHEVAEETPDAVSTDGPDPRSPTGIATGIGVDGDDIGGRIDVFETVSQLAATDELVETVRTTADGFEQNVYELSETGRDRARSVRRELGDRADDPVESLLWERASSDGYESGLAGLVTDAGRAGDTGSDRFVGRRDELATLTGELDTIQRRGGRTYFLTGDRGVGKSMLGTRLVERARERGMAVGRAACQRDSDEPYGPLRRTIESAFDPSVCQSLADTDGELTDDPGSLSARRTALLASVAESVCARTTERPAVLFVDDLQWAGPSTIALFERLAIESAGWIYPLLLVGAYRPTSVPENAPLASMRDRLAADARVAELAVEPFDRRDTGRFVRRYVGGPVPDGIVDRVHEATGGIPLIVDEAVTTMLDADAEEDEAAIEALDVPAGAERAVERRVESLDEDGRRVLEAASVVGRPIPYDVLREVVSLSDPDLRGYVRLLVAARILDWTDEPETSDLTFPSDLVRETVRSGIDPDRRERLHARIADALVGVVAPSATIAHHCEEAGQYARAIDHYERAARHARRSYAGEAALDGYERALALSTEIGATDRAASIHLELGVTRFVRGEYDAAADHFATARDRTDDLAVTARARHRLAEIQVKRGAVADGIATATAGLENVTDAVRPVDHCRLLRTRGWGLLQTGDLVDARATFERELSVADDADDPTLRALAWHDLGTLDGKTGDVERATRRLTDAVTTFEREDEPNHCAKSLTNLALSYRRGGHLGAALEANDRALAIQREHGFSETLPDSQLTQAELYRARGPLDRAVEEYEAAIDAANEVGRDERAAKARTGLAAVLARQGHLGHAERCCQAAIDAFDRLDAADGSTLAYTTRTLVHELAGEFVSARADADHALSLARGLGNDDRIAEARDALGRICRTTGNPDSALEHHEAAVALAADGGNDVAATRFRVESVADLLATDAAERARERADEAVTEANGTGDRLLTARARARYGRACRACGDYERAATELEAALEIQRECGARADRCETLLARCELEHDRSRPEAAAESLDVATALIEEYGLERFAERARRYVEKAA